MSTAMCIMNMSLRAHFLQRVPPMLRIRVCKARPEFQSQLG